MFKQLDAANELAELMRRGMLVVEAENHTHSEKLNDAVTCLNNAAELFEDIGMSKSAEDITKIIEKMASKGNE